LRFANQCSDFIKLKGSADFGSAATPGENSRPFTTSAYCVTVTSTRSATGVTDKSFFTGLAVGWGVPGPASSCPYENSCLETSQFGSETRSALCGCVVLQRKMPKIRKPSAIPAILSNHRSKKLKTTVSDLHGCIRCPHGRVIYVIVSAASISTIVPSPDPPRPALVVFFCVRVVFSHLIFFLIYPVEGTLKATLKPPFGPVQGFRYCERCKPFRSQSVRTWDRCGCRGPHRTIGARAQARPGGV